MMRMLIVEDHTVVRQAFRILLSDPKYGIEIVGEAGDGMEAIDLAQTLQPDVIVMDLLLPRLDGVAATSAILQRQPAARILVLTSDENEATALAAITAGALGFVRKRASTDELIRAILAVATDYLVIPRELAAHLTLSAAPPAQSSLASSLTAREQDVLAYLVQGFANEEIARTLGISVATVRTHVAHLLHKLGVDNRTQAALIAVDRALLSR